MFSPNIYKPLEKFIFSKNLSELSELPESELSLSLAESMSLLSSLPSNTSSSNDISSI